MNGLVPKHFACGVAIIVVFFIVYVVKNILPSIEINEMEFENYSSIPDNSGVKTWLPMFFPKKSENIEFYSNLDLNKFGVKFSLNDSNNQTFKRKLIHYASLDGETYIKKEDKLVNKTWCKIEKNTDGRESLYLIGNYKDDNTYYLINVTGHSGREDKFKEKLSEEKMTLCNFE